MEGGTNYACTALSQGWRGSPLSLVSPYPHYLQVKAESGIHGIDEGSGGLHAENHLRRSTFPGHEGVPSVPIEDPACINHTDVDAIMTYDSHKDGVSTNAVTEVSRKKHATVPSQATIQPTDIHGTPKRLFPCDKCNKQYAQPQGVTRHQREAHEITLCMICNDFKWSRRYQLAKHLKERHPGINLDATLCEVTSCRREATMNKKQLRQQQAPPAIECDRRSHGESLPRSLMHTVVVAKDSQASLLEDARGLGLFDPTTNAPSASSSTEERPWPVNDAGSVKNKQTWSSVARTGGSTPSNRPSSFVTMPIPILYSPHVLDIIAVSSSGQIPSIPRDRFYADMDSYKHWAGPNQRY